MFRASRFSLALVIAGSAFRTVHAQEAPVDLALATLADLMKITVTTATLSPEDLLDAPARVQVVTAAEIQGRGYRALSDVLEDLVDFKVDYAGDPDLPTQLTVQGTRGANRIVLLLDGVRISSPTGEPLPILANYPVHNARQIEIVYGPASALYGADAFSAVVNVISMNASESAGISASTAVGQFGLFSQTFTYGGALGTRGNFLVSGQLFRDTQPDLTRFYPDDFQGLQGQRTGIFETIFGPMSSQRPVAANYESPVHAHSLQAMLRIGGLQFTFFENRSRVSSSVGYTPDNAVYNDDAFSQNELAVGSASYTRRIHAVDSTSSLTLTRHQLSPESGYWNVFSNMNRSFKFAYGASTRAEQQFAWKASERLSLTTGGVYERFYAIPQGADLNAPISSRSTPGTILGTTITDDFNTVRYANGGIYAQAKYALTSKVAITLGARGDYSTDHGGTFNPRVGLVAKPVRGTTLKVLYGTAFLAPSPYQKYAHWGSFYSLDGGATYASDFWHVPNPNLKPQHKKTVEVNLLQELGLRFNVSASAFASRFTDLVRESDPDESYAGLYKGWPVSYILFSVNEGRATNYGGTLGVDFLRSFTTSRRIAARAAVAYSDGNVWDDESVGPGVPTSSVAPVQLRFSADIDWDRWVIAPRVAVSGTQRVQATTVVDDRVVRRTLPGYATLDVNIRRQRVIGDVGMFVTVENALDQRYRNINPRAYTNPEELIGAPQNPRRFTVGFDLRFR